MSESRELKAGDPCPKCGGGFQVNQAQHPDTLIEHHRRVNPTNPELHGAYRRRTEEKARESGIIHGCTGCGYQARYQPKKKAA